MPTLSTKFTLQDGMSKKLQQIAKAGKDVKQSLDSICTVTDDLEDVSSKVDDNEKAFEQLSQKVSKNSESTKKFDDAVKSNKSSMDELKNKTKTASTETDKFSTSTTKAKTETDKFGKGLKDNEEPIDKFKEKVKGTGEETDGLGDKMSDAMDTIGTAIASVGLIAFLDKTAEKLGECIDLSSKFETAIAKTSTLTAGTGYNQSDIKSDMTDLSMKTGKSTEELSEAQYQALSAGVAANESAKFVEKANALAVGGFTQTDTAVDIMTTAINAYNLSVEDATSITDDLIMTQNLGKTTVNELASNMGRVIPTAAAYNLDLQDLSASYAVLTASGIATAESTTYLNSMINELGDSGSDVSKSLQDVTGKSFKEMMDSGKSLGDVVNELSKSVDNDSTAFANLWSSQEAGKAGLALLNAGTQKYNDTLNKMVNSTGSATSAYETMSNTSEHTTEAFTNSVDNFKKSVGDSLIPTTEKFKKVGTEVLNGLSNFVKDNPDVVSAVTSLGVSVGVLTTAIVGYNAVTKLAKIATTAFNAVMNANPIFLVGTAIATVVAGLTTYRLTASNATDETEKLSASSQRQKDKLDELKDKLKKTKEEYGENSYQTQELERKVTKLSETYKSTKQTQDEYEESLRRLLDTAQGSRDDFVNAIADMDNEKESANNLINRLSTLAGKSKLTTNEQREMSTVISMLNEKYPKLNLSLKNASKYTGDYAEKLKKITAAKIVDDNYDDANDKYTKMLKDQMALKKQDAELTKDKTDAQKELKKANEEVEKLNNNKPTQTRLGTSQEEIEWTGKLTKATHRQKEAQENLNNINKDAADVSSELIDKDKEVVNAEKELQDAFIEKSGLVAKSNNEIQNAITNSAAQIESDLQNLAESYDKTYSAYYKSFSSQFDLWDKVEKVTSTSTDSIAKNLDSQITYWDDYENNLTVLQGYTSKIKGLKDVLLKLNDGSKDSASVLKGMADSVKNGDTTTLQNIITKYSTLDDKQKKLSSSYTDIEKDFKNAQKNMVKSAEDAIDKLNLSDDAKQSAKDTIDAYINEITSNKNRISGAMSSAISGAKDLLVFNNNNSKNDNNKNNKFVVGTNGDWFDFNSKNPFGYKHAIGTDYAEDVFIAGEEGPELVIGQKGAKVYTAQETRNLLYGDDKKIAPNFSINTSKSSNNTNNSTSSSADKTVTIKLEGLGSIKVVGANKNTSKEDIVNVMTQNLKPVLINILNEEIFEEGDDSYEY